ncbi:MAG: cell division protein FtsL [Oscillospiraceae bacterium]|nr:cell division protein FtsL [Oscillospiraceae bacterium]
MAYYDGQGNRTRVQYNSSSAPAEIPPVISQPPKGNAQFEMERNSGKKVSIFKVIGLVFLGFTLLGAVILSNVQQLQISNQITEKKQEYMNLQSENVRMQSELAGKTSNKNIQEYAENVLGMRTIDGSQIEYVEIQTNDVVEIPDEEQNVFVKMKTWFNNLVEYLRG